MSRALIYTFGLALFAAAFPPAARADIEAEDERAFQARAEEASRRVAALAAQGRSDELRRLGAKALPHLAALFRENRFRATILPALVDSGSAEARKVIEEGLAASTRSEDIFMTARALGVLQRGESKEVLLKKLRTFSRAEPDEAGIAFGGDSDWAHFMLIWAVARIEGQNFGGFKAGASGQDALRCTISVEEVNACLRWWRENRARLSKGG
ncbi:MAG: hypothetical protein U0793_12200 [Gemmataceae bacterium]